MKAIGFDNEKYLKTQSEQIRKRIAQFGGKLYLEFASMSAALMVMTISTSSFSC